MCIYTYIYIYMYIIYYIYAILRIEDVMLYCKEILDIQT
jgi:hypothetical protein